MQHVYVIRGAAGSGKSFLADIIANYQEYFKIEADMYFMQGGQYNFDRSKLGEAHAWCQAEFEKKLKEGRSIVVSNTGIKKWEVEPYFKLAKQYGAKVTEIIVRSEDFGSVHNVPEETVERMKKNFEF